MIIALFLIPEPEPGVGEDDLTYQDVPEDTPTDDYSDDDSGGMVDLPGEDPEKDGDIHTPKLVIVIDDVGYNTAELEPLLRFPGPITFAILPQLDYSVKALGMIKKAGKEAILHQPMEPEGDDNPGPGAILTGMGDDEIRRVLRNNLQSLKGVRGANNHMGSKATSDSRVMNLVMQEMKGTGLFFLDSKTTAKSVVRETADILNMPFAERSVFLDNTQERESIMEAFREGMAKAEKQGHAVMIGHVWSHELADILLEVYPQALEEGFEFLSVTDLIYKEE